MPCYSPLSACVVSGPQGRTLSFTFVPGAKALSLPCGRCIGCRLERARQWAVRLMHEAELHDAACFLTLTYSPEFLPKNGSIDVRTCQLFLKRLRARIAPIKIRFFLCGEYGEKFERPHYHMILFGYDFPDKVKLVSPGELTLYRSDLADRVWRLGGVRIGAVSFESAWYVANYATKKIAGEQAADHYKGRVPEFLLMSRGGRNGHGIGHGWIKSFLGDVYPMDEVVVRGRSTRPPRYYDALIKRHAADEFPPGEWTKLLESIQASREAKADELQAFTLKSGDVVHVAPSRNARRLAVRKRVAEAKLRQKTRSMENDNA